jgi:hypothetical protein
VSHEDLLHVLVLHDGELPLAALLVQLAGVRAVQQVLIP